MERDLQTDELTIELVNAETGETISLQPDADNVLYIPAGTWRLPTGATAPE